MDKQTIEQELRWFGTTLNECPNERSLFARAAGEIARLEALQAPVKCLECRATVARSDEWYRCFDCKSNLCSRCVEKHFGASYSRHHRTMEEYKTRTETAEAKVATLERQLAEAKARHSRDQSHIETWDGAVNKLRVEIMGLNAKLAEAKASARTPGTVEVCERYVFHDCVNNCGHFQWKYGVKACTYGSCPRKIPAGGHPAHEGERLSGGADNGPSQLSINSERAQSPEVKEADNV